MFFPSLQRVSVQFSSVTQPCPTHDPMDCSMPGFPVHSWSLLKLMSIELVMPPNQLILCGPLLMPSIIPIIRVKTVSTKLVPGDKKFADCCS